MRPTRVYLPLSRGSLDRLAGARILGGAPLRAYAVTRQLERAHPGAEEEDLEYLALGAAAEAAATILDHPGDRRIVAAADVEPGWVEPPGDPDTSSQVRVTEDVPLRRIVSFHLDEAGPGGPDEALLWYDVTELDEVVRMLGR